MDSAAKAAEATATIFEIETTASITTLATELQRQEDPIK